MSTAINPEVYTQPRKAILCLGQDVTTLRVRQMLLEHFGYKVWTTDSVEDAASIAEDRCPDMLLMDSEHPDGDVEQVAARAKDVCPDLITVVLLPFYGARCSSHASVDRFLPRDNNPDLLVANLEDLFERKAKEESTTPSPS